MLTELVSESNLREAARLIGRGREQVRKFIAGEIETPHPSTREAIARVYMQKYGGAGMVAERPVPAPTPTPLKLILPQPLEKATAEIRAVFELARRAPESEWPDAIHAIEKWLLNRVRDEYAAEVPFARPRQRRPKGQAKGKKPKDDQEK